MIYLSFIDPERGSIFVQNSFQNFFINYSSLAPAIFVLLTSWILRVPWYIFSIPRQHAGHTRVAGVY